MVLCVAGPAILLRGLDSERWNAPAWFAIAWALALTAFLAGTIVGRHSATPRSFAASLIFPSVGLALTLPLTIHLVAAIQLGSSRGFDEWVWLSVRFAGLPHVVAAIMLGWRALQVSRGEEPVSPGVVYVVGVISGLVPIVVPALIVAVTGLPLVALMKHQDTLAARDRDESSLPEARALAA